MADRQGPLPVTASRIWAASAMSAGNAGWLGWTKAASSSSDSTGAAGSRVHCLAACTRIGWVVLPTGSSAAVTSTTISAPVSSSTADR